MNFFTSNSIRRVPLALAAVAALGFAIAEPALATPDSKVGESCTVKSGPYKGKAGIYRLEQGHGHGQVVCTPLPIRITLR